MSNENYEIASTLLTELSIPTKAAIGGGTTLGLIGGGVGALGGSVIGKLVAVLTRNSDLKGNDKVTLDRSVANYCKQYNLNINNPRDKQLVLNFVQSETERIKRQRGLRRVAIGTAAGAIGGGAFGGAYGARAGHQMGTKTEKNPNWFADELAAKRMSRYQ